MTTFELTKTICQLLSARKAQNIVYISVAEKTTLCDYFVIAGGRSTTQVKALAEYVDEKLDKDHQMMPRRAEGVHEGRWAVLDYGDVIVHIFNDEERDFYHLERLWEDGQNLVKFED